jgi:hypothetical protein
VASLAGDFARSVRALERVWRGFRTHHVLRADPPAMLKSSLHWFATVVSGGGHMRANGWREKSIRGALMSMFEFVADLAVEAERQYQAELAAQEALHQATFAALATQRASSGGGLCCIEVDDTSAALDASLADERAANPNAAQLTPEIVSPSSSRLKVSPAVTVLRSRSSLSLIRSTR